SKTERNQVRRMATNLFGSRLERSFAWAVAPGARRIQRVALLRIHTTLCIRPKARCGASGTPRGRLDYRILGRCVAFQLGTGRSRCRGVSDRGCRRCTHRPGILRRERVPPRTDDPQRAFAVVRETAGNIPSFSVLTRRRLAFPKD